MFMNERKSGTEHVTATLEAAGKAAIVSSENVVFNCGDKFAATVTPATGEVAVSNGVMSWGGRISGIKNTESVSYSPPESETLYKKVVVCAQYQKNTETSIETIELTIFESDVQSSESAANALTVDTGASEITSATEIANFPLWTFVATSISATTPVQLFDTVSSLSQLLDTANNLLKAINSEVMNRKNAVSSEASARQTADSAMQTKITAINSSISSINSNLSSMNAKISELGKKNIILSSVSSDSLPTYTSDRPITDFSMLMVKYKNVDYGYFEYYCIPAIQMSSGEGYYHVIRDYKASGSGLNFKLTTYLPRVIITTYNENFTVQCVPNDGGYFVELIGIY